MSARVLAGLGIALAVVVVGCGGGAEPTPLSTDAAPVTEPTAADPTTTSVDDPPSTEPPATTSSSTITAAPPEGPAAPALLLAPPEGWASSGDGRVVAANPGDLEAVNSAGARVVDVTAPDMAAFVPESAPATAALSAQPVALDVAGFPAVAVTLIETLPSGEALATTTLVIGAGEGTVQVFLLQAPADGYADVEATLLAAIQPAS